MPDLDPLTRARLRTPLTADQLADIEGRGIDEGGQIHQDSKALLAEIERLKVELADTGDALGLTQRRINELHQGEQPPPQDERVQLSPAQMIWRWNRASPADRLKAATYIRAESDKGDRYETALRTIAGFCRCSDPSNCASSIARAALAGPESAMHCSDNPACDGGCCAKEAPGA